MAATLFINSLTPQQKECFNAVNGSGPEYAAIPHFWQSLHSKNQCTCQGERADQRAYKLPTFSCEMG
jgi:hypothetical protein